MCVIIHGLRKKHLTQEEIVNAMRKNSSGFWMAHWAPDCKSKDGRETLRTLREDDAVRFFNETPDDHVFVMHARIPSKGGVNLDNVHGWEDHDILFAHNMTLSCLSDLMTAEKWEGTDSEYFFRKMFIPMHVGEHLQNPDLPESEMGPATKRLVSAICGTTNKFLFVMPDNTVVRAGHWDTIATEKRICMEEREYDVVVSEKVNDKGNVEKLTEKVKRKIPVEREFAVAVASNTYYRPSTYTSAYGSSYGTGFGTGSGYGTGGGTSYTSGGSSAGAKKVQQGSLYDDEWEWYYRRAQYGNCGTGSSASDDAKKSRVKKSDIEAANVEQFMKWRASLPSRTTAGVSSSSFEGSPLFGSVKVEKGMIDPESFKDIFNILLRALVYVNFRRNNSSIVRMMDDYDSDTCFESERLDVLDRVMEDCPLDKDFLASVVSRLYDISGALTPNLASGKFTLPSEAVMAAFSEIAGDLDAFAYQYTGNAEFEADCGSIEEYNEIISDDFRSRLHAIDSMLNLSFDPSVKANKDVEKYVKAAFVNSRKLRWIPTPLLIAPVESMVSNYGTWVESKQKEDMLRVLNMLAEAAVTDCESLVTEDRKYVAKLKELGYDFDNLGSTEIFVPGKTEEQKTEDLSDKETAAGSDDKGKTPAASSAGGDDRNAAEKEDAK